jgi:HemY protein
MLGVIGFLIIGLAVIAAAWGLGNLPGHVSATVGSFQIETSSSMAILALVVAFLILYLLLRILVVLFHAPGSGGAWWRRRRVRVGERAITRVLVALAAGEDRAARREAKRVRELLGDSPQTLLLCAEAGRLGGREDEAEEAFRALTKQEDGKFLGYRGLLRQAVDRRDWVAADAIAKQAEAARPGTAWLRQQRAELAIQHDAWAEAAELSDPSGPKAAYYVAAADAESDNARALGYAKLALKADPTFTPAVLAFARRQSNAGSDRRAQAAVAEAWKRDPHPDLADWVVSKGTSPAERYQLAKKLVAVNPTHPESRLLLAKTAIDAGMVADARQQLDALRTEGMNQRRMWLLFAEVEEHEKGDTEEGRAAQRDAFRQASVADADPAWRCTNCRSDTALWAARCPSCGSVGTLKWQASAAVSPAVPALT